ncbi:hypothetical protein LTR05_005699 [Lithohypha guttulata]|uniref:Fumarylacetoacetase n=1 Tax=Lithohypha guttulata TaxID=1690604 RepID=A0AAN7SY62_9EURO|nr:hypothetical protein LTR05_005699 [Lithohypha guttulata]
MRDRTFAIQNLPYGVISHETRTQDLPKLAVAYKDFAIDVLQLTTTDFTHLKDNEQWTTINSTLSNHTTWNAFASLSSNLRSAFRKQLRFVLSSHANSTGFNPSRHPAYLPLAEVTMHLPFDTRNYSDFACSYEHASNCSKVMNISFNTDSGNSWFVLPQVYNGRTSSLAVSGTPVKRPHGIFPLKKGETATFQAENKLDFELEMGVWVSRPVERAERLDITDAKEHIFGLTLLNDWSARSIQSYEMQPLGPFHSKGTLTSISPWIVPIEALEEFAACPRHTPQSPPPLPHLDWKDQEHATWNINIKATLVRDGKEYVVSESNLNELHWTPLQQITHSASAGAGLSPGDVLGTGTISSSRKNDAGEKNGLSCLLERRLDDAKLSTLPDGLAERFLEDGDEVVLTAWVEDKQSREVLLWFGECKGKIEPANSPRA